MKPLYEKDIECTDFIASKIRLFILFWELPQFRRQLAAMYTSAPGAVLQRTCFASQDLQRGGRPPFSRALLLGRSGQPPIGDVPKGIAFRVNLGRGGPDGLDQGLLQP